MHLYFTALVNNYFPTIFPKLELLKFSGSKPQVFIDTATTLHTVTLFDSKALDPGMTRGKSGDCTARLSDSARLRSGVHITGPHVSRSLIACQREIEGRCRAR